jgi:hypothetical protein
VATLDVEAPTLAGRTLPVLAWGISDGCVFHQKGTKSTFGIHKISPEASPCSRLPEPETPISWTCQAAEVFPF